MKLLTGYGRPRFQPEDAFPIFMLVMLIAMLSQTIGWEYGARLVPLFVGFIIVPALAISLFNQVFRRIREEEELAHNAAEGIIVEVEEKLHMDIAADHGTLLQNEILRRALIYLGWVIALMTSIGLIGFVPSATIFVIAYMRLERNEPWWLALPMGAGMGLFLYLIFDQLLNVIWPGTYLGEWFPALDFIPSV